MAAADPYDFYAIHACLRRASGALADAVRTLEPGDRRRAAAIGRYWDGFAGDLHLHHRAEDELFYPALTERVAVAADHLAAIEQDHHVIDELLEEAARVVGELAESGDRARITPAAAVLDALDDVLCRHLAFEDADIVPLFARHFSHDEYEALTATAVKSVRLRHALFAIPFLAAGVTPEVRDQLLEVGGLPVRMVYRLTRRRHARLARLALGPDRALQPA